VSKPFAATTGTIVYFFDEKFSCKEEIIAYDKCFKVIKSSKSKNRYHKEFCDKLLFNYFRMFGETFHYKKLSEIFCMKFIIKN
jgi:hypothetical protein